MLDRRHFVVDRRLRPANVSEMAPLLTRLDFVEQERKVQKSSSVVPIQEAKHG